MAMSKGTSHYNRASWEDADFPLLCQTCLGDNPYLRMMKEKFGSECKICQRPFTTFRWCPGQRMRYKKTEVCQTCARAKNVCQTCLLDLVYGLPVQVRDQMLGAQQAVPKDEVNRAFYNQQVDTQIKASDPAEAWGVYKAPVHETLARMARSAPYYKRNRAHICSFWVKGECKRGEECPYRHEKPTDPDDPLSDQNIRDRYHGNNDPVADKLLKRMADMPKPTPPEDKQVTTLYIGNVGEQLQEQDLREYFVQFGELRNVAVVRRQNCAFVTFATRSSAETAIERSFQRLQIHGQRLIIRWGKSLGKRGLGENDEERSISLPPVPGLPVGAPPDYFGLVGTSGSSSSASAKVTTEAAAAGSAKTAEPSTSTSNNQNRVARVPFYYPSQDPDGRKSYKSAQ